MDPTPSSSTWQWIAQYGLFYNPSRGLWAQYDAQTGEYNYLPPSDPSSTTGASKDDDREEGELSDHEGPSQDPALIHDQSYNDPSLYAFPSNDDDDILQARPLATEGKECFLRLVALSSSCLSADHRVALLSSKQPDGYSIGRDRQLGVEEGRIRLREMEVSKTHAIVFYTPPEPEAAAEDAGWGSAYVDRDAEDALSTAPIPSVKQKKNSGTWAVVDLGSTHGTFVKKGGKGKGVRLSEPKVAGLPYDLQHEDILRVGTTSFQVHLHDDLPCDACSLSSISTPIPTSLHPDSKDGSVSPSSKLQPLEDPFAGLSSKERLQKLKVDMLKRPGKRPLDDVEPDNRQEYIDRSAARRAVHPSLPPLLNAHSHLPASQPAAVTRPTVPQPIEKSNVGHALLMKHGWQPGQSLGLGEGRVEPVESTRAAVEGKRGLGMKSVETAVKEGGVNPSWRDEGRERRWKESGLL